MLPMLPAPNFFERMRPAASKVASDARMLPVVGAVLDGVPLLTTLLVIPAPFHANCVVRVPALPPTSLCTFVTRPVAVTSAAVWPIWLPSDAVAAHACAP